MNPPLPPLVARLILAGCLLAVPARAYDYGWSDVQDTRDTTSSFSGRSYANLWDYEQDLIKYHDTAYLSDIQAVTQRATAYILHRAAEGGKNLAVVLDIDETSLSDWKEITGLMDFGYNDGLFKTWARQEEAEPIPPTVELFRRAKAAGVKIFFVSGRPEELLDATAGNLRRAGYEGWSGLDLRPADYAPPPGTRSRVTAFKTMCRQKITAQGFDIVANLGDQNSDLKGGYADRTFKLPNPFYFIP